MRTELRKNRQSRTLRCLGLTLATLFAGGCHSAFVQASVTNHTGAAVRLVEVDYPSASFGTGELADGATFKSRFKIMGSGAVRLTWTDAHEKEQTVQGPSLQEGEEGTLAVTLETDGAHWRPALQAAR